MRRAEWTAGDDALVGVVGSLADSESPEIDAAVDDHGGTLVTGPADAVLERSPTVVVCVGESALSAVVRADTTVPVLPVDVPGVPSPPADALRSGLEAVFAGDVSLEALPILRVATDSMGEPTRALFDAALLTDEPARISEYSVTIGGDRLAQFRADGVVVATPAGSHGYTSAVGGPLVSRGLEALVVVPVAPFVTQTRQWVVPDEDIELAVERDEGPVTVQVDDRSLERVSPNETVSLDVSESIDVFVPDLE